MNKIDRRQFLEATVAGASALSAVGCAPQRDLDRQMVISVGDAVLPDEIGFDGASRVTDEFLGWIAGYSAGAELNHAYGSGHLSFSGDLPIARWIEQLQQLDAMAQDRFSRPLNECTKDERRHLLRDVVEEFPGARLGNPRGAEHVAVAILGFFYRTSEATDLAYRASIKKQQCRPLGDSPNHPIALG